MKKIFLLFTFSLLAFFASAQLDSSSIKISLLTCAPGDQLYSLFGHSALRVQDEISGRDEVYNYGMFSFRTPNFYTKFVRGKLRYWLGKTTFDRFVLEYEQDGRALMENEIQLTYPEKRKLLQFLQNNLRKENRFYSYDFFYDNCSSRLRDALEDVLGEQLAWPEPAAELPSYRDQLDLYLGNSPWSDFGIDLILGKPTDDDADFRSQMFLPDFLKDNMMEGVVTRAGTETALLSNTSRILDFPNVLPEIPFYKRPFFLFSILFLLILGISWKKQGGLAWKIFDFVLIFTTGLAGCLFLFMWFGTDHQACFQNWNMLWAFPLNIIAAFLLFTKSSLKKKYFTFYFGLVALSLLGWFFWPQQFNIAFLPIMLIILLRIYFNIFNPDKEVA